ncbi:nickel/cobalt transporter [Marinomonas sp. TW1]|uniref:nickel/cobalt transporter n=1 Tax=Marinomonas sp. TW1 TaxID=1561203 RepID=UPI0007AFDE2E|nr:nickel/cobalt transporter [Marinomonas sp. TW1]KZN12173.1 nickel transporter [Marinomonas sp. TW1]
MAKNVVIVFLSFFCFISPLYAADFSLYQDFIQWVISQQANFHRELVSLVRAISKGGSLALLWSLVSVSFLYGVFHAAGPGHGKAVISSYMLASRASMRKGIVIAFLCAAVQGFMAVALILVLGQIFSLAGRAMQISRFFEIASFAAVGLIGVWILSRLLRGKSGCGHDHSKDHLHHDHDHDHDHDHGHHACCDQHDETESKVAKRGVWAMILAVGIRPCTGAVLVLLFSMSAGIFQWGLAATFAMSLGTAITVSGLAAVSVLVRDTGFMLSRGQSVWRQRVSRGFGFAAALALILISSSMIWSYLSNASRAF